jgi:hypothetical protein
MKNKLFVSLQLIFLAVAIISILIFYPRTSFELNGNSVSFNVINANVIVISKNSDFSNSRYVDINDSLTFNLKPGKYYYKAINGIIKGFTKEFEIDSEIGLEIIEKNGEKELKNVGDVKINVTKRKDGIFVGHVILEPEEKSVIEDGDYIGRQDENV